MQTGLFREETASNLNSKILPWYCSASILHEFPWWLCSDKKSSLKVEIWNILNTSDASDLVKLLERNFLITGLIPSLLFKDCWLISRTESVKLLFYPLKKLKSLIWKWQPNSIAIFRALAEIEIFSCLSPNLVFFKIKINESRASKISFCNVLIRNTLFR